MLAHAYLPPLRSVQDSATVVIGEHSLVGPVPVGRFEIQRHLGDALRHALQPRVAAGLDAVEVVVARHEQLNLLPVVGEIPVSQTLHLLGQVA